MCTQAIWQDYRKSMNRMETKWPRGINSLPKKNILIFLIYVSVNLLTPYCLKTVNFTGFPIYLIGHHNKSSTRF